MNLRRAFLTLLTMACGLSAGCSRPAQRSLVDGGLRSFTAAPRTAHIRWINVADERPDMELGELKPETHYMVPPFVFSKAGHLRPDAGLYSSDPSAELTALVRQSLDKSKLMSDDADDSALRLTINLKHLYGISYRSSFWTFNYTRVEQFSQYGYAAAEVVLSDATNKTLGTRQVVGAFLPDAEMREKSMTDALTLVAVKAAGDLARNIVRAVEPLLAPFPEADEVPAVSAKIFFLARAVPEAPFLEVAGVDYESGEVVSDVVVPRVMEPCSAPDEWVVDPYFGGKARLTQPEYEALVDKLRAKYDVRYVSDVRTAHFLGVLAPAAPDPKAKPRRSAAKKK
jgi:hypothetical protein